MESIKAAAQAYKPQQTHNICDLQKVSVDLQLEDREGVDKDNKAFSYKVVVIAGEEYRVPGKVLGDLKSIIEKKPDLKTFAVMKKGTGLATTYTVIPLD